MAKYTAQAHSVVNLLDTLSVQGHGSYTHFRRIWQTSMSVPQSIYQAAQANVAPLSDTPTRIEREQRVEAVALECERIASDPERVAQAVADHPQATTGRFNLTKSSGASR